MSFEDAEDRGVRFKYSRRSLADIGIEDLREVTHELNMLSDHLGCVVFEGTRKGKGDLVIFAGNLERFSMLSAARDIASRVFYFQDTVSWWYGGSPILPDIRGIGDFLEKHISGRHCVAFGQSSGGYAALSLGGLLPEINVLACSPQTFADRNLKKSIRVAPSLTVQYTPDYLMDIAEIYKDSSRSGTAAAIFSASEYGNPYQSHYWLDHLHLANISKVPSIDIHICGSANHSIVFQRAAMFSECLRNLLGAKRHKKELIRAIIREFVHTIKEA